MERMNDSVAALWVYTLRRCMVVFVLVSTFFFSVSAGADNPSPAPAPRRLIDLSASVTPLPSAALPKSRPMASSPMPSPTPNPPPPSNGAYYISTAGSDARDGLTPQTGWRTFTNISRVPSGAVVLAQAGGVWTENIKVPSSHMIFGVYGTGAKPKIIAPGGQYAFDNNWKSYTLLDGWEFTSVDRAGGKNGIVLMVGDNYHVRNIVIHGSDVGLILAQGYHGLIEHSEFYDSTTTGAYSSVTVLGHRDTTFPISDELSTIQSNQFHDIGYRSLELGGTALLAQYNTFTRWTLQQVGSDTLAPGGIYVWGQFPGPVTVRNNTFNGTGVEGGALWVDTGPTGVVVTGNVATNAFYCFWSEKTNGTLFTGNTCQNMTQAGVRWGDPPPEGPASNGGIVSTNTFVGATPKEGWIVVYPNGSSVNVSGNTMP